MAFRSEMGRNVIEDWKATLSVDAVNEFRAVLTILEAVPRQYWRRPQFDVLSGDQYKGMGEIRFNAKDKTYRVFGFFGPDRSQFTLLIGCEKKGGNLDPRNALETAAKRKKMVERDKERIYEFKF